MRSSAVALLAAATLRCALADEPDWPALPYTTHAEFQAIDSDGFATFPLGTPTRLRGVIVADPADLLDPASGAPGLLGGQWQLYVQTVDAGDFGGTACWMGELYGNLPFVDPSQVYSPPEWAAELERLNHDPNTGHAFAVGDLVEVRGRVPGLPFGGKTNVNEAHSIDPNANFDVVLLSANYGVPTPTVIKWADVKDANDVFIFDSSRLTGAELYQSTLIRVNHVQFTNATGWGPNATMTVTDGSGQTLPVLLGRGAGFDTYPPPGGTFDIVGIFDQEDSTTADGYRDGYRLWVTHYTGSGCIIPEPWPLAGDLNCDGTLDFADINPFVVALLRGEVEYAAAFPCCRWTNADLSGDGAVDFYDINPFVAVLLP